MYELTPEFKSCVLKSLREKDGGDQSTPLDSIFTIVSFNSSRYFVKLLTSTDKSCKDLLAVVSRHPLLCQDEAIVIPCIYHPFVVGDSTFAEAHICRYVEHIVTLDGLMIKQWLVNDRESISSCLRSFGVFLKSFHVRHAVQHCDLCPSNVLVTCLDPILFVLVDSGGVDDEVGRDVEVFLGSLEAMAEDPAFGKPFLEICSSSFREGYEAPVLHSNLVS